MTAPKPAPTRAPRTRRDPRDKAQEALDVANRKVARVDDQIAEHEAALLTLRTERGSLVRERDYLAQHPALREPDSKPDRDIDPEETS